MKLKFSEIIDKEQIIKDYIKEKKGIFTLSILGFLQFYLLTKILDIASLGEYIIFSSLAIAFSAFFDFGISYAVVKYLPISRDKSKTLAKFLSLQLLIGLVLLPIFYPISPHLALILFKKQTSYAFLAVIAGFLDSLILTFRNSLVGFMDYSAREYLLPLEGVVRTLSIVGLAFLFSVKGAVFGFLIGQFVVIISYMIYLIRKRVKLKWHIPDLTLEEIFNLVNFNIIAIARNLYYITDLLIVGALLTPARVAIYKIASLFSETVMQLVNLREVLAPRFSKWSKTSVRRALLKVITLHALVGLIVLTLVAILAKPLILILFGADYLPAAKLVILLSILVIIDSLSYINLAFEMKNLAWISSASIITLIVLNAILDYILIPRFDVYGAVYATLISYALSYTFPAVLHFVYKLI